MGILGRSYCWRYFGWICLEIFRNIRLIKDTSSVVTLDVSNALKVLFVKLISDKKPANERFMEKLDGIDETPLKSIHQLF